MEDFKVKVEANLSALKDGENRLSMRVNTENRIVTLTAFGEFDHSKLPEVLASAREGLDNLEKFVARVYADGAPKGG